MPVPAGQAPVAFGEWIPDNSPLAAPANEAKGVLSQNGRYAPINSPATYNGTSASTSTRCIGAFGCYDDLYAVHIFLADQTHLYHLVNKASVDVSKGGGYTVATDGAWRFEQFGTYVVAVAPLTNPQVYQLRVSSAFADLAGSPIQAEAAGRVLNFLVLGKDQTLAWSAQNDITSWTPSPSTQAGTTTLPIGGGKILAIVGGETGTIFQQRQIQRMTYVGPPTIWDIALVEEKRGALSAHATAKWGRNIFFAAEDGFYVFDGYQSQPIGQNKVDAYFTSRLNYSFRHRVCAGIDPAEKQVWFAFPTTSDTLGEALIYSLTDNRWTHDDISADWFFEMPREGYTVETLDTYPGIGSPASLDLIPVSIDSPALLEGRRQPAIVNTSHALSLFTGSNRPAILETTEFEPAPGRRGMVTEIWPIIDAPTANISASIRARGSAPSDTAVESQVSVANAIGCCPVRVDGRFLRAKVYIGANATWTYAQGIHHDVRVTGAR